MNILILRCKLAYLMYSPYQYLKIRLLGVKTNGIVYSAGRLCVNKANSAEISIGKKCRFMSKSWGNNIGLNHNCMLSASDSSRLVVGDYCSFSGVSIWCFDSVIIGNRVRVGANCLIMDGDAHQDDPRAGKNKPIVIEDNVWLGGNVVVKKGVTIGRNSVIGMNSVVTQSVPANSVAIGNPCRVVKNFDSFKIKEIEDYLK